jgi:hypothetical protein
MKTKLVAIQETTYMQRTEECKRQLEEMCSEGFEIGIKAVKFGGDGSDRPASRLQARLPLRLRIRL